MPVFPIMDSRPPCTAFLFRKYCGGGDPFISKSRLPNFTQIIPQGPFDNYLFTIRLKMAKKLPSQHDKDESHRL